MMIISIYLSTYEFVIRAKVAPRIIKLAYNCILVNILACRIQPVVAAIVNQPRAFPIAPFEHIYYPRINNKLPSVRL